MADKITSAQRSQLFNSATRKYLQTLAKEKALGALSNIRITLPKARYLSKVILEVNADVKVTGTAGAVTGLPDHTPYNILKRVTLSMNNGFDPFSISGQGLYLLSLIQMNGGIFNPTDGKSLCNFSGFTASTTGTSNKYTFFVEIPVIMNENSNTGLILLQNSEVAVDLSVDVANNSDIFVKSGYSCEVTSVEVQPTLETFSVPTMPDARPDLSVLKLVNERTWTLDNIGENVIKMSVGTIYRKLVLYITDDSGVPVTDSDITGSLQLVFNQADAPVQISPKMLRAINTKSLGFVPPVGCYIFDFSTQAFPNLGGSRDFIDTEKMQEFWVKVNAGKTMKCKVVTENLTRLI